MRRNASGSPRRRIIGTGRQWRAFTLIELLVVCTIVALLLSLLVSSISQAKAKAKEAACLSNQRQTNLALQMFAQDHAGLFPWNVVASEGGSLNPARPETSSHFKAVASHLATPQVLACPADLQAIKADRFPELLDQNLSYFVSFEATEENTGAFLTGDSNLVNAKNLAKCSFAPDMPTANILPGSQWTNRTHRFRGLVSFRDGSALATDNQTLRQTVLNSDTINGIIHVRVPER